jgi:hypothetical protein
MAGSFHEAKDDGERNKVTEESKVAKQRLK